jgi:putative DNA-invertase from lambdoid prophage Rac
MIYCYIRVSTSMQTVENQRFEIENYCKARGIAPDHWVSETVSGAVKASDRRLGELLKAMKKGDTLIVTELSRLGRKILNIMNTLNTCMEAGFKVIAIKGGYELGDNLTSHVLAFAFSISAQVERELISMRTKEGLAKRKAQGAILGRKTGSRSKRYKLSELSALVASETAKNTPLTRIAEITKTDRRTVKKFINELNRPCGPVL